MNTVQVTSRKSQNAELLFSYCTRTALLLGNTHTEIGAVGYYIINNILEKQFTPKQKIVILQNILARKNDDEKEESDDEIIQIVNDFLVFEKTHITNKHPNKQTFLVYKGFENTLVKLYEAWNNKLMLFISELSIDDLEPLLQKNVFDAYGFLNSQQPITSKDRYLFHPFNVLSFSTSNFDNTNPIWLFHYHFYNLTFLNNFNADSKECNDAIEAHFIEIAQVKNINLLKHNDIKNIKQLLAPQLQQCNVQLQAWANDCYTNNANENLLSGLSDLKNTYNNAIENNELLQRFVKLHSNSGFIKLFAGEISYEQLINFYEHEEEVDETMKERLLEWYSQQAPFKIPVIIFCMTTHSIDATTINNENIETDDEQEVTTKKYLSID